MQAIEMPFTPVGIGVVGVGAISGIYFNAINRSPALRLSGVAARNPAGQAQAIAERYGAQAMPIDALLADPGVEVVVNLTPAAVHDEINAQIIEAGRHIYSEKPFCLSLTKARAMAEAAAAAGLCIGSAPDTFFGGTQQLARELVDDGRIGRPVFGASFVGRGGIEEFHPNPEGFYQPGGEGPYDIGPYYLNQWVNLLGPVRRVFATGISGKRERTIRTGPRAGQAFPVLVPSTFNALLTFDCAEVSLTTSLDVVAHRRPFMEVYGTDGAMYLPDPNHFGGAIDLYNAEGERRVTSEGRPFSAPNRVAWGGRQIADYRGVGLVDLALAIRTGGHPRTGPQLFLHIVEVMAAIVESAAGSTPVTIETTAERPPVLGTLDRDALLLDYMRSPSDLGEVTPG